MYTQISQLLLKSKNLQLSVNGSRSIKINNNKTLDLTWVSHLKINMY